MFTMTELFGSRVSQVEKTLEQLEERLAKHELGLERLYKMMSDSSYPDTLSNDRPW